ncbi:MAG: hypothetical protein Wins2KO_30620 [Winogradskyella sp.]
MTGAALLYKMFEGYQSTELLWNDNELNNLKQLKLQSSFEEFKPKTSKKLRLGKWVEQFVSFLIQNQKKSELLAESIQIKNGKITIGELDFLYVQNKNPIHLEVVYKFYLYDTAKKYDNPLEHWIGPNRKDALTLKLDKLKEKQLPLLYHEACTEILKQLNLRLQNIKQYVHFKAQLFVPYNTNVNTSLNENCIVGFYLSIEQLDIFKNHLFYIPTKLEWLVLPNDAVNWLGYDETKYIIEEQHKRNQSPLLWVKQGNKIEKCFVVWW